jgi:hypothetical protein
MAFSPATFPQDFAYNANRSRNPSGVSAMHIRLLATLIIWGTFGATMITMFIAGNGLVDVGQVILGMVMAISAFLGTGIVWDWGEARESTAINPQKAKREAKLDALLEKLNGDDLAALRERLMERMDDPTAVYGVGEDGELVKRR